MIEPTEIYPSLSYDELAQQLEEARREIAQLQAGLDASVRLDAIESGWRAAAKTPPAARWIADGEHAGYYLYAVEFGKWRRVSLNGAIFYPLSELPPATEPLYSVHDVELALDAYRAKSQLRPAEHDAVRDSVMSEVIDAAEYAIAAVEMRHEQAQQAQRCHRTSVAGRCSSAGVEKINGRWFCTPCADLIRRRGRTAT